MGLGLWGTGFRIRKSQYHSHILHTLILKGEPNNWHGNENCQEFRALKNYANDVTCNKPICMICQIPTNEVFHLQGNNAV